MRQIFAAGLLPLLPACGQIEQADGFREVTMAIRVFGPAIGDWAVSEAFCQDLIGQFNFVAVGMETPPQDTTSTQTDEIAFFEPLFDQSDDDPPSPPALRVPGGCVFLRDVFMIPGEWSVTGTWVLEPQSFTWTAICMINVSLDESTTNNPFLSFTDNGENFDTVEDTTTCVYDDLDGDAAFP